MPGAPPPISETPGSGSGTWYPIKYDKIRWSILEMTNWPRFVSSPLGLWSSTRPNLYRHPDMVCPNKWGGRWLGDTTNGNADTIGSSPSKEETWKTWRWPNRLLWKSGRRWSWPQQTFQVFFLWPKLAELANGTTNLVTFGIQLPSTTHFSGQNRNLS